VDPALLALALAAGAVAAVNPCGFALLPAYVGLAVSGGAEAGAAPPVRSVAVGRALRFTLGMTVGFVLVFALFALTLGLASSFVVPVLPYVTVAVGLALLGLGAWLVAGRDLAGLPVVQLPGLRRLAGGGGALGNVAYGVTFALASLSCTIGPFLSVWAAALRAGPAGLLSAFVVYAVGMGAVVGVLSLSTALAQTQVMTGLRRLAPVLPQVVGVLVVLAGSYVVWYGLYELRVAADAGASDPVVELAVAVQGWLTRSVLSVGTAGLVSAAAVVALAVVGSWATRRRRTRGETPSPTRG
jgi:cytochrome c biogenesis protein CcdA